VRRAAVDRCAAPPAGRRTVRRGAARVAVAAAALALATCSSAVAAPQSLPGVGSGHRPGPDVLHEPPAVAPQLENIGPWRAAPILVSGAQAYRAGEWMYQDFLYDDHGAVAARDNNDPYGAGAFLFSEPAGTFTYPTDPVYAHNAADLVELRVKPLADATAFRVTLNTLQDPARAAFTIALGSSAAAVPWPHGAGVRSPAQLFLTVHGTSAELTDAATGAPRRPAPTVQVDGVRRQFDVRVPHAAWDPGQSTVRMTIGTGLWDTHAGRYLAPSPGSATSTTPGGGSPTGTAIVNVGPRFDEPFPQARNPSYTLGDAAVYSITANARWWRDQEQAYALAAGDVSHFYANVDFAKLAAAVDDDSAIPRTGPMDRILASHYAFGQGMDPSKVCFDLASNFSAGAHCVGRLVGQLQPYALYVPNKPQPPGGWGMTLLLHSLSAGYNQYSSSVNQAELGNRGAGTLVVTPSGRGPDGFYAGIAEADTFETWADVARRYRLDPNWTTVSGYSMGGYGTYRMLARWPDLFARGFSVVGAPGTADPQLRSLRNTPLLAWNATFDELVPLPTSESAEQHDAAAGLRFIEDLFPSADHLSLSTNDEYAPGAAFLGTHRVDRNPAHVTYVVNPVEDSSLAGAVADHAYWLSGLRLRGASAGPTGTIDVRSEAFGTGDPKVLPIKASAGALTGGGHGPMPFVQREQDWGPVPATPKVDRLDINATNIGTITIDPSRARVDCHAALNVTTDGPLSVVLSGCNRRLRFAPAAIHLTVRPRGARARARVVFVFRASVGRHALDGAVVRFGRLRARTNRRGVARIVRRLPHAGVYRATVAKRGLRSGSVRVRAIRRVRRARRPRDLDGAIAAMLL
jgi:hypothetical protein